MQTSKKTNRIEELVNEELMSCRINIEQADADFLAESLLEEMNDNPLGNLLKVIGTLPEVRYEKVNRARRIIAEPESEVFRVRMDVALDRVLEELMIEG
ncbi:MAG: hypothetical protein ACYSUT_09010 [Planctomycetota bacterium]|jgi:hypothetical protein